MEEGLRFYINCQLCHIDEGLRFYIKCQLCHMDEGLRFYINCQLCHMDEGLCVLLQFKSIKVPVSEYFNLYKNKILAKCAMISSLLSPFLNRTSLDQQLKGKSGSV